MHKRTLSCMHLSKQELVAPVDLIKAQGYKIAFTTFSFAFPYLLSWHVQSVQGANRMPFWAAEFAQNLKYSANAQAKKGRLDRWSGKLQGHTPRQPSGDDITYYLLVSELSYESSAPANSPGSETPWTCKQLIA